MTEPVTTQPKSLVVITHGDMRFTQPDSINGMPEPNLEESDQKNKQTSANQQSRNNTDKTPKDSLTTAGHTRTTGKRKKRRGRRDGFNGNDDGLEEPVVAGTARICFICDCCGNDSGDGRSGDGCGCGDWCDCIYGCLD